MKDITNLNELLLAELLNMKNPISDIGPLFSKYSDFFKIYTLYCSGQVIIHMFNFN